MAWLMGMPAYLHTSLNTLKVLLAIACYHTCNIQPSNVIKLVEHAPIAKDYI